MAGIQDQPGDGDDNLTGGNNSPQEPAFDAVESFLRLLIGSSIEVPVELAARLKEWEAIAATEEQTAVPTTPGSSTDNFRHTLVGLLFETHDQVRGGLSRVGRLASASSNLLLRAAQPISSSRPMQPVHGRYNELVAHGEKTVNRWLERGQSEEPHSRLIAVKPSAKQLTK